MTSPNERSVPDVADGHRRLMAFALLALGAKYLVAASTFLVDPGLAPSLELLGDGLVLLAVGMIAPIFVWKARNMSRDDWHLYKDDNGFVAQTIARAQTSSWTLTFLVLVLTEPLDETLGELSWVLLFDLVLAVMLLSFSITFLYLDRATAWDSAATDDA